MSATSALSQAVTVPQIQSNAISAVPGSIPITLDASMLNQLLASSHSVAVPTGTGGSIRGVPLNQLMSANLQASTLPTPSTLPPSTLQAPPLTYAAPTATQAISANQPPVLGSRGSTTVAHPVPPPVSSGQLGLPQPAVQLTDTLAMAESRIKKLQTKLNQQEAELAFKVNQHKAEQKRLSSLEMQNSELRQTLKLRDDTIATLRERIASLEANQSSFQERIRVLESAHLNHQGYIPPPGNPPTYPHPPHQCCQSTQQGATQPLLELLIKELCASRNAPSAPAQVIQPQPQVIPMPMPMPMPYPMYMPPIPVPLGPGRGLGKQHRPKVSTHTAAPHVQPNYQPPAAGHSVPASVPVAPHPSPIRNMPTSNAAPPSASVVSTPSTGPNASVPGVSVPQPTSTTPTPSSGFTLPAVTPVVSPNPPASQVGSSNCSFLGRGPPILVPPK